MRFHYNRRMRFQRIEPLWLVPASLLVVIAAGINSGISRPVIHRTRHFSVVAPVGEVEQLPGEVEWQVVPGAVAYAVLLLDQDGSELWSAESRGWRVAIAPATLERLPAGRTFRWQVVARDAAGKEIAAAGSQTFRF